MDATHDMKIEAVQKKILDNYFSYLQNHGYISPWKVQRVAFAVMLLDSINTFSTFIDDSFKHDVDKVMRKLNCCDCQISWNELVIPKSFICL